MENEWKKNYVSKIMKTKVYLNTILCNHNFGTEWVFPIKLSIS